HHPVAGARALALPLLLHRDGRLPRLRGPAGRPDAQARRGLVREGAAPRPGAAPLGTARSALARLRRALVALDRDVSRLQRLDRRQRGLLTLSRPPPAAGPRSRRRSRARSRSEEHTSELQSRGHLVCRLLLEK